MNRLTDSSMKTFRFWCQKVLPLVYDNSLSYYEVLCKVVEYLNKLMEDDNQLVEELAELQAALEEVQELIDNFDTEVVEKYISESLAKMIFVEISDAGYFIFYIPEGWEDIVFNTTGYDVEIPEEEQYGHLVLSY